MRKGILVIGFAFLCSLYDRQCYAEGMENLPKLMVRGEASVFKPADQMEVSLGVVTSADQSAKAVENNNQSIRQILANLKSLGLDETDYQTGHFHVKPVYQTPAKDSVNNEPGKISHYEVLNTIQVKTQKISLANQIIHAAVQGGANEITEVNFNLSNPQAYRGEAIKLAAQNALADAHALASATEVKIKRILDLSLDHWQKYPQAYMLNARGASYSANVVEQETMEPGQTEIHALVNMTIEIGE